MSSQSGRTRSGAVELVHHYVGGDGEEALNAFLEGYRRGHSTEVRDVYLPDAKLQVKSRILTGDPPDIWTGWPGADLQAYANADALADITEIYQSTGMEANFRSSALDAARVNDAYRAVPYLIHRTNDLYINVSAAERMDIDPRGASTPRELATMVSETADAEGAAAFLLPMKEPWTVLQLWEVVLLGQTDHATYSDITDGRASPNRNAIRDALDIVSTFADAAPEDSMYNSLVEANERFMAGEVPVYSQGDWSGGAFVEADDFEYDRDWERIPFPGTDRQYVVVMDAALPSAKADIEAIRPFLEYAGSPEGQELFATTKGAVPARKDISLDRFSAFGQDQAQALERASDQAMSMAHGLAIDSPTRIELLSAFATFITNWDSEAAANAIVDGLDG